MSKIKDRLFAGIFIIPAIVLFNSFTLTTQPRLEKKMDQLVNKLWKDKDVERVPFLIPPDIKPGEETEIYKLVDNNRLLGYMVLNKAFSCRVGGCAAWSPGADESNYDPFYYVVIVGPSLTIDTIKILEYYSEYGYEITNKHWLAQFSGKTGCNLTYQRDIDGISGATISAKSMIRDMHDTCKMLEDLKQLYGLGQ